MDTVKMKSFREWESGVKEYCQRSGVKFDQLNSYRKRWGIDLVDVVDEKGNVILRVGRGENGKPVCEETDYTRRVLRGE